MAIKAIDTVPKEELFVSGHTGCGGCGQAIATRLVLKATGKNVIVVTATGCLETFAGGYLISPWEVPWIHSLFENAAAVAAGVEAALKTKHKEDIKVVVLAGDGSTFDIGFGMLSGMVERRHNVLYICMDNQAYVNTGYQRSGATTYGTATTTTPAGKVSLGKVQPAKDVPAMMVVNGADYVATASPSYPWDLMRKVKKAVEIKGPTYIQIHIPCPTAHAFPESKTIEIGRIAVETGMVPLYEMEKGKLTSSEKIGQKRPVEDYLKRLGWYKHLFAGGDGAAVVKELQRVADENIVKFNL